MLTLLGVLLLCRSVPAEPMSSEPATTASPEPAAAERHPTRADIVLVGSVGDDRELALLFEELLEHQDVTVDVSSAVRFDPALLFGPDEPDVTRVFVVLRDEHSARLHFRGPRDERYLLRKVALPNGLDAVGRELLAQVVESSVMALLHSTEGLSREEATAELARDSAGADAPAPVKPAPPPEATPAPPRPRPSAWELHFGLKYAAAWSGPELGIAHGPGLVAGARYRTGASVGVELGAARYFTQSLSTPDLQADVQRTDFYGLVEGGLAFAPSQSGFLAFGPALELSRVRPFAGAPGVTLTAPKTDLAPLLRAELRYELASGSWSFGAAAFVDVSLVKTNYELDVAGESERLASPARLRPGAQLSVAVR